MHSEGLQMIVDMINAMYGLSLVVDDVTNLGISILKDELEFNRLAGFTPRDDRLPDMFKEEVAPHNTTWDFTDSQWGWCFPGFFPERQRPCGDFSAHWRWMMPKDHSLESRARIEKDSQGKSHRVICDPDSFDETNLNRQVFAN